jgi:hypothetical protein
MKICTVIGQSSDMNLRSTHTNEIPASAQLHTSVDRQTAAQMQNRSSMSRVCTQSSSRTSHGCEQDTPRSAVYVQNGTAGYAWKTRTRASGRNRQKRAK